MFKPLLLAAAAIAATTALPAAAQSIEEQARFAEAQSRFQAELAQFQAAFDRYRAAQERDRSNGYYDRGGARVPYPSYDDNRADAYDRNENGYDPSRYYRSGPQYGERVLAPDDRVYAGEDGRYYCKRNDGTTGLIVGGAAGGLFGNVIDGGHSRIVGTLLGGAAGALAGRAIDQNNRQVVCR
ncbi:glycine zipper 2TM domain-containing protein [Hephaestia sp. GCM10023244]|uniref:glycine zipper 2TM domain-containing protein n=1 Tax=unclassified Hephaestia TaxID=2631281 RepID=UPI0020774BFE|nr:glycine zipper 2TM domain-containing protein [Hephaestia sp. MAHUQ-44]MCM8730068.1 glycine zipper 2TM domain-containing protein [Hephaestia sp. MAHUQ-44]